MAQADILVLTMKLNTTRVHEGSVLLFTIATIMYCSSVHCRPARSSSQERAVPSPHNGLKKGWPSLSSSSSSYTTRSNQTTRSHEVGPGRSRFHRDFRRRTVSNFTPLHDSHPSLGPNSHTSEQTRVYSAEKRGGISVPKDELCSPFRLRVGQTETSGPNGGYQFDSDNSSPPGFSQLKEQGLRRSYLEQSWLRQDPLVECGPEAMRLRIRRRRAGQLLLDSGNGSALALSQLPTDCGLTLHTSGRDLALTALYHGCHVALEGHSYVLYLLWRGVPVKVSCPAHPSSHCCSTHGMTVILHGVPAGTQLHARVRGEWTPVPELAQKCGYTLHQQARDLQVELPFLACGVGVEDGNYSLTLQIGDQEVTLTCPIAPEASPQPPPWVPPFYLAPPYFPHPAYPSSSPVFRSYDGFQLPSQPSVTIRPPAWRVRPDSVEPPLLEQNHTPATNRYVHTHVPNPTLFKPGEPRDRTTWRPDLVSSERPSEDPYPPSVPATSPRHAGEAGLHPASSPDQYYHYYHLPKIPFPLPSPPPHPNPGTMTATQRRHLEEEEEEEEEEDDYVGEAADAGADNPPSSKGIPVPRSQDATLGYFDILQQMVGAISSQLGPMDQSSNCGDAGTNPNPSFPSPEPPSLQYQYQQPARAPVSTTSSPSFYPTPRTGTDMLPPRSIPHNPLPYANFNKNVFLRRDVPHHRSQLEEIEDRKEARDGAGTGSTSCLHGLKAENSERQPKDVNQNHGSLTPSTPPFPHPMYRGGGKDSPLYQAMHPFFHYPLFHPSWGSKPHVRSLTTTTPTPSTTTPTPSTTSTPPLTASPSPNFFWGGNNHQNVYYHPFYLYHNLYGGRQLPGPPAPSGDGQGSPEVSPEPHTQTSTSPTKWESTIDPDPLVRQQYSEANDHSADRPYLTPPTDDQKASTTAESTLEADDFAPYHYYQYYQPVEILVGVDSGTETSVPDAQVHLDLVNNLEPFFEAAEDGNLGMDQYQSMSYHSALNPDNTAQQDWYGPLQLLNTEPQGWQDCAVGQHVIFLVPDCVEGLTVRSEGESADGSEASCIPQRLQRNPQLYAVPLEGCGVRTKTDGEGTFYLLELQGNVHLPGDPAPLQGIPVRFMVACRSSHDMYDAVTLKDFGPTWAGPVQTTAPPLVIQTRIATDASFTEFLPDLHLPLSSLHGQPLHLEVRGPGLGSSLLVHYCLAYTETPHPVWVLLYHGCWNQTPPDPGQPPPSALRVTVPHFFLPPSQPPSEGPSNMETEVTFLCHSQACSKADGCSLHCTGCESYAHTTGIRPAIVGV